METRVEQAIADRRAFAAGMMQASLFSCDGKLAVRILELAGDRAVITVATPPRAGSVAVLARNGLRLVATIAAVEGQRVTLRLDDPLEDWRHAWFGGASRDAGAPVSSPVLAHAA